MYRAATQLEVGNNASRKRKLGLGVIGSASCPEVHERPRISNSPRDVEKRMSKAEKARESGFGTRAGGSRLSGGTCSLPWLRAAQHQPSSRRGKVKAEHWIRYALAGTPIHIHAYPDSVSWSRDIALASGQLGADLVTWCSCARTDSVPESRSCQVGPHLPGVASTRVGLVREDGGAESPS
ncbi:hypothetical protein B0H19DRAFT_1082014 [Mycena capillaripes]|nr:hypothetical protein B0H19DRAFT_1082014 [Mycena capillaripes]